VTGAVPESVQRINEIAHRNVALGQHIVASLHPNVSPAPCYTLAVHRNIVRSLSNTSARFANTATPLPDTAPLSDDIASLFPGRRRRGVVTAPGGVGATSFGQFHFLQPPRELRVQRRVQVLLHVAEGAGIPPLVSSRKSAKGLTSPLICLGCKADVRGNA